MFIDHGNMPNVRVKTAGKKTGLWRRDQHYLDRNACLNMFVSEFGGDVLRYTKSKFLVNGPIPKHSDLVSIPSSSCTCYECEGESVDDCVKCEMK